MPNQKHPYISNISCRNTIRRYLTPFDIAKRTREKLKLPKTCLSATENIPLFIISLARATERREHVSTLISKLTFHNVTIIDAVDGKQGAVSEADLQQINAGVRKRLWKSNDTWIRTKIAIDLSHIRVLHAFLATSAEMAVVLEDDAESGGEDMVPLLHQALCQTPNDFDILYLNAHVLRLGDKVGENVHIFWDGSGTTGSVITRRFAIRLLDEYTRRPARLWVDLLITAMIKAGELQAYICDPPFVQPRDSLKSTYQTARPKGFFWENLILENG